MIENRNDRSSKENVIVYGQYMPIIFLIIEMNIMKLILDTAKNRSRSLEREVRLIDEQLSVISTSPGISMRDHTQLIFERNIKLSLRDVFVEYLKIMKEFEKNAFQLHRAVSCHLFAMNNTGIQVLLQQLYGHRLAMSDFVEADFKDLLKKSDDSFDVSLSFIHIVFPFQIAACLLCDEKFCTSLLKNIMKYDPKKHKQTVNAIFNEIGKYLKDHPLSPKSTYFKYLDPVKFYLAEHFVCMLTNKAMIKFKNIEPENNLIVNEKCNLFSQSNTSDFQLDNKIVEKLKAYPSSNDALAKSKLINLQPIDYTVFSFSESSGFDENETFSIPELRYAIYEIRKVPLMVTPTEMLIIFSRALIAIQEALAQDGKLIGADESFQFFSYSVINAKLDALPLVVKFIEFYMNNELDETKFSYIREQLKIILSFIDRQTFQPMEFILFPFSKLPTNLENMFVKVSNDPIYLKGFEVYAIPFWKKDSSEGMFPALFRYSGGEDRSVGFQYILSPDAHLDYNFLPKLPFVPTIKGSFLQLTTDFIENHSMVKIDGGDYNSVINDVEIISSMLLMANEKDLKLSTSSKNSFYESFIKKQWHMTANSPDVAIPTAVARVQKALVELEQLPDSFLINGIFDTETLKAIKDFVKTKDDDQVISPRIFNYIISCSSKANTKTS